MAKSPEDWGRDDVHVIEFHDINSGLGIKVIGGMSEDEEDDRDFGIFIKKILNRGLASKDGRLYEGDQVLEVNNYSLEQVTNAEAVSILRQASSEGYISMTVCRDQQAKEDFAELLSAYSFSSNSSVYSGYSSNSLKDGKWSWGPPDGQPHTDTAADKKDMSSAVPAVTMPKISNAAAAAAQSNRSSQPTATHAAGPTVTSTPQQGTGMSNSVLEQSLSLDPNVLIGVEKLQLALCYLGLKPTEEQLGQLRRALDIHPDGTVTYGEFVKVARELFKFQMEAGNITPSPQICFTSPQDVLSTVRQPQVSPIQASDKSSELRRAEAEKDVLRNQVERLKQLLRQKEHEIRETEHENQRVRKEAQGAVEQCRCVTSKLHLAEQANKQARNMERDYEEVIRSLEEQLIIQQQQHSQSVSSPPHPPQSGGGGGGSREGSMKNMPKRMAILSAQLKKAETAKNTYEVAAEKLMTFAQGVSETLSTKGAEALVKESKHVVKTVKSIIDVQPLPFGWEEAYTEDGSKYYLNHVTQQTSWHHPVLP